MSQEKLIEIKNLKTFFNTEAGIAKAVNDVSFDIYKIFPLLLFPQVGWESSD